MLHKCCRGKRAHYLHLLFLKTMWGYLYISKPEVVPWFLRFQERGYSGGWVSWVEKKKERHRFYSITSLMKKGIDTWMFGGFCRRSGLAMLNHISCILHVEFSNTQLFTSTIYLSSSISRTILPPFKKHLHRQLERRNHNPSNFTSQTIIAK